MRITNGIAMLALLAGCSGSENSEEIRAAKLIHGLEDKLVIDNDKTKIVTLTKTSPVTFNAPVQGKIAFIFTVTKVGKCKYQTYLELSTNEGQPVKLTTDLTGLMTDGYPPHQPHDGSFRVLRGSNITCERIGGGDCTGVNTSEAIMSVADASGEELSAMATKFKQDFCQ